MSIEAKIVLDSVSSQSHRLMTFLLRYPKLIHSEFLTHRVFSRNSSSSRAVPVSKNIEEVRSEALRAAPVYWGSEKKSMQSGDELPEAEYGDEGYFQSRNYAMSLWQRAAVAAAAEAELMVQTGVHKSIVNRVLEPYLHINTLVTATEYGNFFGLRLDRAAQPEMRVLAEKMWREYNESEPKLLHPGQWHLPFVESFDDPRDVDDAIGERTPPIDGNIPLLVPVSVARCARISYMSFETGRRSTVEEDLKLYEKLVGVQPMHASPAEHQATPDRTICDINEARSVNKGWEAIGMWFYPIEHGNFVGWRQYRKMLPGEASAPLPEQYR